MYQRYRNKAMASDEKDIDIVYEVVTAKSVLNTKCFTKLKSLFKICFCKSLQRDIASTNDIIIVLKNVANKSQDICGMCMIHDESPYKYIEKQIEGTDIKLPISYVYNFCIHPNYRRKNALSKGWKTLPSTELFKAMRKTCTTNDIVLDVIKKDVGVVKLMLSHGFKICKKITTIDPDTYVPMVLRLI